MSLPACRARDSSGWPSPLRMPACALDDQFVMSQPSWAVCSMNLRTAARFSRASSTRSAGPRARRPATHPPPLRTRELAWTVPSRPRVRCSSRRRSPERPGTTGRAPCCCRTLVVTVSGLGYVRSMHEGEPGAPTRARSALRRRGVPRPSIGRTVAAGRPAGHPWRRERPGRPRSRIA